MTTTSDKCTNDQSTFISSCPTFNKYRPHHGPQARPEERPASPGAGTSSGIADLLKQVGAARSIVIDEEGVVLAGNGVLAAAGRAGIEKVQVVDADGKTLVAVRRAGLTPKQKAQLAVGDNRSNELSEWDVPALTGLADEVGLDLVEVGFTPEEISRLGDDLGRRAWAKSPRTKPPSEVAVGESSRSSSTAATSRSSRRSTTA